MTAPNRQAIADRFRAVAAGFSARVAAVTDWDAPTPVKEWVARDVVTHLTWIGDVLGDCADLGEIPSAAVDPVATWAALDGAVQDIVDDPATMAIIHRHEHTGENPVPVLIDRIYTGDVFFHTWDLARSNGLDDALDPKAVHDALVGMTAAEEFLRPTGQFGQSHPVPDDATEQDRLFAFLGRDPAWRAPTPR